MEIDLRSRKYSGLVALVDDEDYESLIQYNWWVKPGRYTFYAIGRLKKSSGKMVYMHHLIVGHFLVDHRNGNGLDNRRFNLRKSTTSSNAMNQRKQTGVSQFKGVSVTINGNFVSQVYKDKNRCYIGTFSLEEDAARAYDLKAKELFGEFARLNFPEE